MQHKFLRVIVQCDHCDTHVANYAQAIDRDRPQLFGRSLPEHKCKPVREEK